MTDNAKQTAGTKELGRAKPREGTKTTKRRPISPWQKIQNLQRKLTPADIDRALIRPTSRPLSSALLNDGLLPNRLAEQERQRRRRQGVAAANKRRAATKRRATRERAERRTTREARRAGKPPAEAALASIPTGPARGRPTAGQSFRELMEAELNKPVAQDEVTPDETNKAALVREAVAQARKGNLSALMWLVERVEGKVPDHVVQDIRNSVVMVPWRAPHVKGIEYVTPSLNNPDRNPNQADQQGLPPEKRPKRAGVRRLTRRLPEDEITVTDETGTRVPVNGVSSPRGGDDRAGGTAASGP